MNNKLLGTAFEREIVEKLKNNGYWVHFISPDSKGAQPFDIIAVKDGLAIVGDCKTCVSKYFNIGRLEDNQVMAFEKWLACGNLDPYIFVKYEDGVICLKYTELKEKRRIKLDDIPCGE